MARETTPAERLGRTANLIIFLGLLYSLLHLAQWIVPDLLSLQGYGILGLGLALSIIALGYGIRYGSQVCLYMALGIFVVLTLSALVLYVFSGQVTILVRYTLSTWVCYRLYRAIPLMRSLRHSDVFPLPMSRYGARVLQRWQHRNR